MHPSKFVRSRISEGKIEEIIEHLDRFQDDLSDDDRRQYPQFYSFAKIFLISIQRQLMLLSPNQDLNDDYLLSVWPLLGYFGIDPNYYLDDTKV